MTSQITLLVDNKAQKGLKAEHGLSILINHNGKRILFDCGQEDALFYNAEKLGISLTKLDMIILSHGHYDHGGNLKKLLKVNPNAIFLAHPHCTQTRYSLHPNKAARTISLAEKDLAAITALPEKQKRFITKTTEISTGIWLTGEIPRNNLLEEFSGPFYLDKEKQQNDPLSDDISLWIETENGLTVICGCCHAGIINTLSYIQKKTKSPKPITNLLGGLHLVNADRQRLNTSIDYLNQKNIRNIYPAHCTGDNAMKALAAQLTNKPLIAQAGLKITLE